MSLDFWQDNMVLGVIVVGAFFLVLWWGLYNSGRGGG